MNLGHSWEALSGEWKASTPPPPPPRPAFCPKAGRDGGSGKGAFARLKQRTKEPNSFPAREEQPSPRSMENAMEMSPRTVLEHTAISDHAKQALVQVPRGSSSRSAQGRGCLRPAQPPPPLGAKIDERGRPLPPARGSAPTFPGERPPGVLGGPECSRWKTRRLGKTRSGETRKVRYAPGQMPHGASFRFSGGRGPQRGRRPSRGMPRSRSRSQRGRTAFFEAARPSAATPAHLTLVTLHVKSKGSAGLAQSPSPLGGAADGPGAAPPAG